MPVRAASPPICTGMIDIGGHKIKRQIRLLIGVLAPAP